jgi:hypothetical protein
MTQEHEDQRTVLLDSGLFTEAVPLWKVEQFGMRIFVNKSRGVLATQNVRDDEHLTYITFDRGGAEYYSGGYYNTQEIVEWIIPLLKSDKAWHKFSTDPDMDDITLALERG